MTWHSIFDLSTLEHRHLLSAYADVLIIQAGYLVWVLWNWSRTKAPRD